VNYPGGGTPPTTFVPVHPVTDHITLQHGVTTLPFTGGDVVALVAIGLGLLLVGLLLRGVRQTASHGDHFSK